MDTNFNFFKEIVFIFKVLYIISSEVIYYVIFRDYLNFIDNITHRLASVNILYVKIFQALASNNNLIDNN